MINHIKRIIRRRATAEVKLGYEKDRLIIADYKTSGLDLFPNSCDHVFDIVDLAVSLRPHDNPQAADRIIVLVPAGKVSSEVFDTVEVYSPIQDQFHFFVRKAEADSPTYTKSIGIESFESTITHIDEHCSNLEKHGYSVITA